MVDTNAIKRFYNVNKLSIAEISKKVGLTEDEVLKIVSEKEAKKKSKPVSKPKESEVDKTEDEPEEEEEKPAKKTPSKKSKK